MWRFEYRTAAELKESTYWGRLAEYGGGGYTQLLPNTSDSLLHVLVQLQKDDWVDQATRAVFIDFAIYNANDNLFAVARSPSHCVFLPARRYAVLCCD